MLDYKTFHENRTRAKRIVELENKAIDTGLISFELDELEELKNKVVSDFLVKNFFLRYADTGVWFKAANTNPMTDEELLQEYFYNKDDWGDAVELLILEFISRGIEYEKELQELQDKLEKSTKKE